MLPKCSAIQFSATGAHGAVHEFELGTVRNLPASDETEPRMILLNRGTRRIVLWGTRFPEGHVYASAFHEPEFRALPKNLEATNELRKVVEDAIERIPAGKPFLVRD